MLKAANRCLLPRTTTESSYIWKLFDETDWNLRCSATKPPCDAGSLSCHSLTLSNGSGMHNIKHNRFRSQIINNSWKLRKTRPHFEIESQTWLMEFQVWLRTLNLYEVHQSSLQGSLEKVRHKSEPADVVVCKHAFIGTDRHASSVLQMETIWNGMAWNSISQKPSLLSAFHQFSLSGFISIWSWAYCRVPIMPTENKKLEEIGEPKLLDCLTMWSPHIST